MSRVWVSQPQISTGIDWSNPLTKGIVSVWSGGIQHTHGAAVPYGGRAVSTYGVGGKGDGSTTYSTLRGASLPNTQTTHVAAIKVGAANSQRIICATDVSNPLGLSFRLNTTSLGWSTQNSGSLANITSAVSANELCVVGLTYVGGSSLVTGAKNGTLLTSTTSSGGGTSLSNGSPALGKNLVGQYFDGEIYLHIAWNRGLSDSELKEITARPWQIFQPLPSRIFVGPAAATGGTHDTTGALTGDSPAVVGTAAHIAIHGTTGVLAGSNPAIAGTAAHKVLHATTGVLSSTNSIIIGSAARIGGFVSHDTTGALAGTGAAVVGAADHIAIVVHATTGALTGQASILDGVSARIAIHGTTGDLIGTAPIMTGVAARSGNFGASRLKWWDGVEWRS